MVYILGEAEKEMKKRTYPKHPLARVLVLLLALLAFATPALAAYSETISVYTGIRVCLDDKELEPKDANGNPVKVFVYNGTTYLPVRAISNALDIPIQWDGKTSSVYIGKHTGDKPAAYLGAMDHFYKDNFYQDDEVTDNLGEEHQYCLSAGQYGMSEIRYTLNGQYTRLTGTMFQEYAYRSGKNHTCYEIYADGEKLWSGTVTGGVRPIGFDLDITGALELTIKAPYASSHGYLGDLGLWT